MIPEDKNMKTDANKNGRNPGRFTRALGMVMPSRVLKWRARRSRASDAYNPARLYTVHEHGMRLNMDELRKKPGLQKALEDLRAFGEEAIRTKRKLP